VADNKLSAKEAALIAQARAELEKKSTVQAGAAATTPVARAAPHRPNPPVARAEAAGTLARAERAAPAATIEPVAPAAIEPVAPDGATPKISLDPAERVAALMAAARAETERQRRRHKMRWLWAPVAVMSVTVLWTLLRMWQKL
jgi:hypothetical protein